eukprot:2211486-Amphidinium_carterae.1
MLEARGGLAKNENEDAVLRWDYHAKEDECWPLADIESADILEESLVFAVYDGVGRSGLWPRRQVPLLRSGYCLPRCHIALPASNLV